MTNKSEAKAFEALVARIEQIAAPKGAIVTAPDRIRNSLTGTLQEVDASIRYRIGTVDILITIECRKRSRKADVRWIQELVTKRSDLCINKTIAVSAKGFSKAAYQAAKIHDIDLRTISEISVNELHDWFLPKTGVVHVFRKIEKIECVIYLECSDGKPTDYGLKARDEFEPIFYHDKIHSPFPAATLFHLFELTDEKLFALPLDGTLTKIDYAISGDLAIDGIPGKLTMKGDKVRYAISFVLLSAFVGYEVAECALASGDHLSYITQNGEIQRSTFKKQLFGLPFEFEHQHGVQGEHHISFRVLNYDKNKIKA